MNPNPFDKATPKRTRTSSGSVVRIFRGEFVGPVASSLRAQGMDVRVLIKEYFGDLAQQLASAELATLGELQSTILSAEDKAAGGSTRQANSNTLKTMQALRQSSYLGVIGEVNLAELEEDMDPNEFYRALSVPPPKPSAIWIVYEYAGLSSVQAYSVPAGIRRAKLPPQKGFFGNPVEPPALPPWNARADYVVKGILRQAIEALANLHESGFVHRSIGRSSLILTTRNTLDTREASSVYATALSNLLVKLSDFGFAVPSREATRDEEFRSRARTFGLNFEKDEYTVTTVNFAIAEDMHALGFVMMGLLLTSLAEVTDPKAPLPNTDEDTLQRLFSEIFEKDVKGQFREYLEAEDAWSNVVQLLDEKDGWTVLETLLLAREKAVELKGTDQIFTVRGLLSNPLFTS